MVTVSTLWQRVQWGSCMIFDFYMLNFALDNPSWTDPLGLSAVTLAFHCKYKWALANNSLRLNNFRTTCVKKTKTKHKACLLAGEEKLQPKMGVYNLISNLCEGEYLEICTPEDFQFEVWSARKRRLHTNKRWNHVSFCQV